MLYFWITNASRAHRAGRNEGSGKNSPVSVSGKGNARRGRKKELSESPSKSCSETQLDKILQKTPPNASLNGSNSQVIPLEKIELDSVEVDRETVKNIIMSPTIKEINHAKQE